MKNTTDWRVDAESRIQHCVEQAGGESQGVGPLPNYFSAGFINQSQYSPGAPKAPQSESRPPSAGTARYPPAPSTPANGPTGIGRPRSARERRRGWCWPPIPRRGNAVRKRACRIELGSQASYPPRSDEVRGIDMARRSPSSLRGIAVQH